MLTTPPVIPDPSASPAGQAGQFSTEPGMPVAADRLHGIDALRAFALWLGLLLHSALAYELPPRVWAVGTRERHPVVTWLVYYIHCFRMELFFLLAGYFAAMTISRRGVREFFRDRMRRITSVFLIALLPVKYCVTALWIWGGVKTGWLALPVEAAGYPIPVVALGALASDSWPAVMTGHLWFLYYLSMIVVGFAVLQSVWWKLRLADSLVRVCRAGHSLFVRTFTLGLAPVLIVAASWPILAGMPGIEIATPMRTWPIDERVLAAYSLFFLLGAGLHSGSGLLLSFGRHWRLLLPASFAVSQLGVWLAGIHLGSGELDHPLTLDQKIVGITVTSVTMALAIPGWTGLFLERFSRPSGVVRFMADSSYWIYLAHLPVVVAFQILLIDSPSPWWVQWGLVNLLSVPVLILSYVVIRNTRFGRLLQPRSTGKPSGPRIR